MKEFSMKIEGMTCGHCVRAVQTALNEVTGVKVRDVAIGSISGEYDPGTTSPGQVAEAIRKAGYQPSLIGA